MKAFGERGESVQQFLDDEHFIRVLTGGRGTAKTWTVAEDITAHCWQCAGAKAIIARETETSQADSSIDSFWQYFATLGDIYSQNSAYGLFRSWNNGRTFRLPSRLAIERMMAAWPTFKTPADIAKWIEDTGDALCGYIEFRGLPAAEKGKLRGMECSYMALVEADQISRDKFDLCLACLRWKGSDPTSCDEKGFIRDRCVVLDTNPPSPRHWIAQLEADEAKKPEPERVMRFWHISTYENEHNLPENYIRDTILLPYADNPAMIERMLYGHYADATSGNRVFYSYFPDRHETINMGWPFGATMVVGMDVGTHNVSVISATWQSKGHDYWWTIREIGLEDSDTERQALELLRVLGREFPFWNKGTPACPAVYFFCDPAAANSNYSTGATASSVKIFHSHGIPVSPTMPERGLQASIAIMNRVFQLSHTVETPDSGTAKTVWHFRIDKERCPRLSSALRAEYRYPMVGEPGYGNDLPLKGTLCNGADHYCDSLRYSILNAFALAKEPHSASMTAPQRSHANPEPRRKI